MVKVTVLQTDNRPSLNYLLETQKVNKKFCDILGYDYTFIYLNNHYNVDNKTAKLYIVNNFLQNSNYDIVIFLDSDAWIQNGYWLNIIINNLINNEQKQGCFSRDPYFKKNTFINSGSFILKINQFTKKFYNELIINLENDIKNSVFNKYGWEDQYYISKYIFENKDNFVIFIPELLNTPMGKVLRHNWWKNEKMYIDLTKLLCDINDGLCFEKKYFIENDYYDNNIFPNIIDYGYEYLD
jgi:hypothetical protein